MGGGGLLSPTNNNRKLDSSSFGSPRLFTKFFFKGDRDCGGDLEPSLGLRISFSAQSNSPRTQVTESKWPWDSNGIGLGIVDSTPTKTETQPVLLGFQLLPPFISPGNQISGGTRDQDQEFASGFLLSGVRCTEVYREGEHEVVYNV